VAYNDFVAAGSLGAAREKGLVSFLFTSLAKLGCLFFHLYICIISLAKCLQRLILISINVIQ
jgi:hypothetical protein